MITIDELAARMNSATTDFCKTRVPTGETGKYPEAPAPKPTNGTDDPCSISDSESQMEQATQRFTKSRSTG